MELKNTLFALSNILDAAEGQSGLSALEPESKAILKFVGANTRHGQEVCVKDITQNSALAGSPVTQMKRIQRLCQDGWLIQGSSDLHHRRITLQLSPRATREMNKVSAALDTQLRQHLKANP
jgi:hypothetical protein